MEKILLLLIKRISIFKDSVGEVDYPRIEELAYLISQTISIISNKNNEQEKNN
jgi:hypothetical protein